MTVDLDPLGTGGGGGDGLMMDEKVIENKKFSIQVDVITNILKFMDVSSLET